MKADALDDMLAILTAGGRNSGERSTARPAHKYRDPAETVEFPAERERQRKEREKKRMAKFKRRGK